MKTSGTKEIERTRIPPECVLNCTLTRYLMTKQYLLLGSQMSRFVCQRGKSVPSIIMFHSDLLLCAYTIKCLVLAASEEEGNKMRGSGNTLGWSCNGRVCLAAAETIAQAQTSLHLSAK